MSDPSGNAAKNRSQKNTTPAALKDVEAFLERAQLAQAPAWRPEPGEVLSGAILGFRIGHTDEYGDYPVVIMAGGRDGSPIAFHAFHQLVRETLREIKPRKGDPLTVLYGGTRVVNEDIDKPEKDQKRYHLYYIESGTVEASPVLDEIEF